VLGRPRNAQACQNASRRARRTAATATAAVAALLATACQGSAPVATQLNPTAVAPQAAAVVAKYLKISPAPGTKNAATTNGITVTGASGGKVTSVSVKTSGKFPVTGQLNAAGTSWRSSYALPTGQSFTVTAHGTDPHGHPVTSTSSFNTMTPASSFATTIFEGLNATYGVGMPIMLSFDHAITNKAAVERSLQLTTSNPVVGSWYWDGDQQLYFRPREYWPAHTTVTFTGHLDGVEGAPGVYGVHTLTQTFSIGQSVIAVASTSAHHTLIYVDGKVKYDWPISTGRDTLPTPNGTYLAVEKGNPVRMVGGGKKGSPGYYNELVNWAVRFTYGGDYFHAAPWSVVNQGVSNVSHGCVNLSPGDAQTYYEMASPGDPITITDSPKAGKWDDGWTQWFLSWSQYLAGSATHQAVEAGPDGSKFVNPATLQAAAGSSPVSTSVSDNYQAS
jgi:lipoprotein-anchoring transpeptidase ErfK/SrfK